LTELTMCSGKAPWTDTTPSFICVRELDPALKEFRLGPAS
jgi:hypothetical protein